MPKRISLGSVRDVTEPEISIAKNNKANRRRDATFFSHVSFSQWLCHREENAGLALFLSRPILRLIVNAAPIFEERRVRTCASVQFRSDPDFAVSLLYAKGADAKVAT
jgi:hypothetical protein